MFTYITIVITRQMELDKLAKCPRAVTSLKYFAEKTPKAYIAASGSKFGLLTSFPVGKVEQHNLRPLTFRELLWASGEKALQKAFGQKMNSSAAHSKLIELLTDYYLVGGMPEAVNSWFENSDLSIIERIEATSEVHRNLIEGYMRDFGKYSGKVKSGKRARAKSLQSYIKKCKPHKTIKLTGTQSSPATEKEHIVMPLYYTEYLFEHLRVPDKIQVNKKNRKPRKGASINNPYSREL